MYFCICEHLCVGKLHVQDNKTTHSEFGPQFSFIVFEVEELLIVLCALVYIFCFQITILLNMECISTHSLHLLCRIIRCLKERGKSFKIFSCLSMNLIFCFYLHIFPGQDTLFLLCWILFLEDRLLIVGFSQTRHNTPMVTAKGCIQVKRYYFVSYWKESKIIGIYSKT